MPKIFSTIFILALCVVLGGAGIYYVYIEWQIHRPLDQNSTLRPFTIAEGEGVKEIAARLEQENLIRGAWFFETYVWQEKIESRFKAGDFEIASAMNIPRIAEILIGKPIPREVEITIIEGWNRQEIDTYLAEKGLIPEGEFLKTTTEIKTSGLAEKYNLPPELSWEGFLFPDTYRVYEEATIEDILGKMIQNFEKKIGPLLPEIDSEKQSLLSVLTLASIVEKESANTEEMPLIASVFVNRLASDRLLESDATVNFATGKKLRQPTLEDTQADSRYNTYMYKGLPPGPICNPSLAAIKAALDPADTDYLYFIHPAGQSAIFARNLEEHKQNRAQYLDNQD